MGPLLKSKHCGKSDSDAALCPQGFTVHDIQPAAVNGGGCSLCCYSPKFPTTFSELTRMMQDAKCLSHFLPIRARHRGCTTCVAWFQLTTAEWLSAVSVPRDVFIYLWPERVFKHMENAVLLANSSPSETDLTFFGDVTSEMGSGALGKQGEEEKFPGAMRPWITAPL